MLIYSKHSNERRKEFAIRTDIIKNENELKIRKIAIYEEGEKHLDGLVKMSTELSKSYDKAGFSCNMPKKIDERTLEFDFIKGKNLDEEIDLLIDKGEINKAIEKISLFIDKVISINSHIKFTKTKDFIRIFGDIDIEEKETSGIVSNVDILCQNAIISDDRITIIDNEWTFDFPIPTSFIVYRIIHYFVVTKAKRAKIGLTDLYEKYKITSHKICKYEKMEYNFQNYIKGNIKTLGELYGDITPGTISFANIGRVIIEVSFYNDKLLINKTLTECNNGSICMPFNIHSKCNKIVFKCKNVIFNIVAMSINEDSKIFSLENVKERPGMCLWNSDKDLVINIESDLQKTNILKAHFVELSSQANSLFINDSNIIENIEKDNNNLRLKIIDLEEKINAMENTKIWKLYRKYKKLIK